MTGVRGEGEFEQAAGATINLTQQTSQIVLQIVHVGTVAKPRKMARE
jgi:hypothetical protein